MVAPFRFDREFDFPVPPPQLWAVLTRTEDYRRWWPWLQVLEADGFAPGAAARCEIRAPLPYTLRCVIHVEHMEPGRRLEATVSGDLAGPARLEVGPVAAGSRARLTWALELRDPVLARLARFTRPAMAWAHDTVVANGLAQFRERAIPAERAPRSTFVAVPPKQNMCPGG